MRPRTLPSGRAIALVLCGGVVIAAIAPPGAVAAILGLAAVVAVATAADARRAGGAVEVARAVAERVPQDERATVTWTLRAGPGGARAIALRERVPEGCRLAGGDLDPDGTLRLALPPDGVARVRADLTPHRRGTVELGPAVARVLGPLGLGWRVVEAGDTSVVRVDPPVDALRRLALDRSRAHRRGGAARRLRGIGSEFESLRDYRSDDDFRWIDWKASARRRRLTAREFQVDEHRAVVFLVDAGRLMATEEGDRSKLDWALGATLALGQAAMDRGDGVGLVAFDRAPVVEVRPGRGRAHAQRLHDALAGVQPRLVEPDWTRAFAALGRVARSRALVVVLTDLVDDRVSEALIAAAARASRRHLVVVATLADTALLDVVATPPADRRATYAQAVAADALLLRDAAIGRLRAAGVEVVDAPADRLAARALETYLRLRRENRV